MCACVCFQHKYKTGAFKWLWVKSPLPRWIPKEPWKKTTRMALQARNWYVWSVLTHGQIFYGLPQYKTFISPTPQPVAPILPGESGRRSYHGQRPHYLGGLAFWSTKDQFGLIWFDLVSVLHPKSTSSRAKTLVDPSWSSPFLAVTEDPRPLRHLLCRACRCRWSGCSTKPPVPWWIPKKPLKKTTIGIYRVKIIAKKLLPQVLTHSHIAISLKVL